MQIGLLVLYIWRSWKFRMKILFDLYFLRYFTLDLFVIKKNFLHEINYTTNLTNMYSRETLTELEAHLHKLEEDHKNKQLALSLDQR